MLLFGILTYTKYAAVSHTSHALKFTIQGVVLVNNAALYLNAIFCCAAKCRLDTQKAIVLGGAI